MNLKKTFRTFCFAALAAAVFLTAVWFYLSYTAEQRYVKACFHSNQAALEQIAAQCRLLRQDGLTEITVGAETAPDEPSAAYQAVQKELHLLREQYQKDSIFPVFASAEVHFEPDGDMLLYLPVKKDRLTGRTNSELPDIRCDYLIYCDNGYDSLPFVNDLKKGTSYAEGWYFWSRDLHSG